jgi:hypothetical protein
MCGLWVVIVVALWGKGGQGVMDFDVQKVTNWLR